MRLKELHKVDQSIVALIFNGFLSVALEADLGVGTWLLEALLEGGDRASEVPASAPLVLVELLLGHVHPLETLIDGLAWAVDRAHLLVDHQLVIDFDVPLEVVFVLVSASVSQQWVA